jgi:hypothetical protein
MSSKKKLSLRNPIVVKAQAIQAFDEFVAAKDAERNHELIMRDVDSSKDFALVDALDAGITERVVSAYERLRDLTERICPEAFRISWDVPLRPVLISLDGDREVMVSPAFLSLACGGEQRPTVTPIPKNSATRIAL